MQLQTGPTGGNQERRRDIYAIDIETQCAVASCQDKECNHALDFNKNEITVIAVYGANEQRVFRGPNMVQELQNWIDYNDPEFTAQNGKFDFKHLIAKGLIIDLNRWVSDTQLMAFSYQVKIPDTWLEAYEIKRAMQNKTRKGLKHRPGSLHSLKTLAPYFLGVEPFWEPESGHNDDAYVLKDAEYTYRLHHFFDNALRVQGDKSYHFYKTRLLPWAKNLMQMELTGVSVNKPLLQKMWGEAETKLATLTKEITTQWAPHFEAYLQLEKELVDKKYAEMREKAIASGRWSEKIALRRMINYTNALEKVQPLNLDSPAQLKWLLTARLGLDAVDLDGEESTGKETLQRLGEHNPEVAKLLEYRKTKKLLTSFYPEYNDFIVRDKIHTNFNITGARTGRLSSSTPNLQQVPGALHELFEAGQGNVLVTRDLSAIEPTILAYYSEDQQLSSLLLNGGEFHSTNAQAMFDLDCDVKDIKNDFPLQRKIAKTVGLAILYGAGARRVLQTLKQFGVHDYTLNDCRQLVYKLRDFYSGVWAFKQQLDKELERGQVLYNYMNRPFKIHNQEDVYMKGLNTLIQGSASDIMQQAALDIASKGLSPRLIVHDELVVEVPEAKALEAEKIIVYEMTKFELPTKYGMIPIKTEGKVSKTWTK